MTRYHGRHRKATTTGRTVAKVTVTGLVVGAPLTAFAAPASAGNASLVAAATPLGGVVAPMRSGTFQVSSPFGARSGGSVHQGQDMTAPAGTDIYAATDGVVVASGPASGFGQWIVLDGVVGGQPVSTVYGHMFPEGVLVRTGARVSAGQVIAKVGNSGESTGPHLHFEVWAGGRLQGGRVLDPAAWLAGRGEPSGAAIQSTPAVQSTPEAAAPKAVTRSVPKAAAPEAADSDDSEVVAPGRGSSVARGYVVKSGDTLAKIATAQGVTGGYQAIFVLNQAVIENVNLIYPGETLRLR